MKKLKLVVAITGASGSIYAQRLLDSLSSIEEQLDRVAIVFSDNARQVWEYELNNQDYLQYPYQVFEKNDFFSPVASGSAGFDAMIVCPCSMGTLGRIAAGTSEDLITRAADVLLKEHKRLILVARETPLSQIHLSNMLRITRAGGIICPASPSFYSHPENFNQLAATVTDRALQLAGLHPSAYRWGEEKKDARDSRTSF